MRKLSIIFALLCAVAHGARAQISYPILYNDVWDGKSQVMPQFYDRFEGKTAVVVINNCAELAYIASHWKETTGYAHPVYGKKCFNEINYLLNANLDMTRESWKPLGTGSISDTPFEGTLYGNCRTIFLRISNPDTNNQGLFTVIGSHGTVMDLHVAGSIDAGNSRKVGGITGLNYGTISGCWVSADVKSSYYSITYDADLGGIAGWNYDGLIEYCCMTGNVINTGGGSGVGGIAGSNDKDIQECAFYGTVTSKYDNDNKYVGDQNATCSNVTDIFEADIYRRGSGWPVFSFAYKYPYMMNISCSGPGTIEASAGGEKGILGWRPGETVTLTVTSGELASLAIKDADGKEIAYENADDKQSYRFKMPNRVVDIKAIFFANWPTRGTGTANDPYIISSTEDWNDFAHNVSYGRTYKGQYIKMTQSINVGSMVGADEAHSFQGNFSGDGHNLNVEINGGARGMAPFHYIKDATIKDLLITGVIKSTAPHVAGLVGFADGTNLIERCTVSAEIYYENSKWVGGFVGHGMRSKTTIRSCVFSGIIWNLWSYKAEGCVGVFWGWSESDATPILENCIESCKDYMAIRQFHPLGVNGSNGTVTDCYYVTPPDGDVPNPCPLSGAIQVRTAAPAGGIYKHANVNGLSVYSSACTVSGIESVYNVEKGAASITPVVTDASGTTLAFGTDYTATLNGNAVTSLPISISKAGTYEFTLAGKGRYAGSESIRFYFTLPIAGSGTADAPYLINNAGDWNMLAANVAKGQNYSGQYVKLTADIEITEMVGVYEGKPFCGTFLGEGHTLTANIKNTDSDKEGVAPFRYVKDATIRDVTVGGTIESNSRHTTGLVGFADGTSLIEGCTVNATLNISTDYAGGIVGHGLASATTIRNCVFAGTFNNVGGKPTNIGAIWGWSDSGNPVLENCLEKGTYKNISSMHPMGLQNGTGTITNCYYLTPQIGSPDRACTVSGARQVWPVPDNRVYKKITAADGKEYAMPCTVGGVAASYNLADLSSITPVVTAPSGTTLTLGTDYSATLNGTEVTTFPISINTSGDYTLTITGKGAYSGAHSINFSVIAQLTGSGTAEAPYLISTPADWVQFVSTINNGKNYSGQFVKLTADIEITEMAGVYEGKPFSGTFLGEGHTLTANIKNTDSDKEGVAPFRYVKDATIRDVTVGGTIESNSRHASDLVGIADGTNLIEGCTVNATLNTSSDYAGGIVGHGLASATTIRNCVFAGTFNNVGYNQTNIGAIWGWSDSGNPALENCLEKGTYKNITSMHPMGLQNGTGTITNCYYLTPQIGSPNRACTVSGARQVWPIPDNRVYKKITAADGKEYAMPCTVGGVAASYNLADLSNITPVVTAPSGTTLTLGTDYSATLNGTEVTTFPISINTGGDYTLTITGKGAYGGSQTSKFFIIASLSGSGTAEAPYLVSTTADWLQLAGNINNGQSYSGQFVKLTADIEITEMAGVYEGKPFCGIFLGEGHTLTANIKDTDSGRGGVAPFRYVKDATIRDVTVGGTIASSGRHASGLVGFADGTNLIEGCTVSATLNISTDYAGGIVGHGLASATTIRNCIFAGTFNNVGGNPTNIGAIWGWSDSGKPVLENCLEKGTYKNISSMHPMGLLNSTGTITNCYYVTPQIGSPDRVCTVSGACQVCTTNTSDEIYRAVTLSDGTYYIACSFSSVRKRYQYTGSDITIAAPTITAANGTKLTAGTDFTYSPETVREVGDYTLTISGKGSYTGRKTFPFTVTDHRGVTSESTVLTTGEYTVFEDVTIAERITIDGSVVLNLGENAKLTAPKGIELSKGNSLTINGPGSLEIKGVDEHKSGIGAAEVGTLVINSGNINILAVTFGAAIGGDKSNTSGGSITINGGKINIIGGLGKCIGGGYDDLKGQYGVCGDIVINGGQLDLSSTMGFFGPGIQSNDVTYKSGTLTLGWTNPDDYIRTVNILVPAQDVNLERISFVEGKPFVLSGTTTVATTNQIVGAKLVPLLSLADNGNNGEMLSRYAGAQMPVTLNGRTLYKDGSWNTLCLPFNVTLSGSPLEGAVARPLTEASISGTTLNLTFGSAVSELVAGTPYVIKWESGDPIVSPVFSPVTIDMTDRSYDAGSGDNHVRFIGTYKSTTYDATDKSILFMGGTNMLHYPTRGANIGAQRAYFKIGDDGSAGALARITAFSINFGDNEMTGIIEADASLSTPSVWYTIDGRKLQGKPAKKGVYISNGRKIVN